MRKVLFFSVFIFLFACKTEYGETPVSYLKLSGKTMGTTYHISYEDSLNRNFQTEIDALLKEVNMDVSTYIDSSFISKFNNAEKELEYLNLFEKGASSKHLHFRSNFEKATEVYQKSNGFFDPTIMPLVNYWGFGYTEKKAVEKVDSLKVDSLMQFVGFDKISKRSLKDGSVHLVKIVAGVQLDFSALAKGYGVDVIGILLEKKGIENYMVEIGGEVRAKGKNPKSEWWKVGINTPDEKADVNDFQSKILLKNRSLATSGNYRNFYKVNGINYAHTINTKTGFPEKNRLLSVSIFADDCMTADAYATACMAMGVEKAFDLASSIDGLDGYFIYSEEDGDMMSMHTQGLENVFVE
jgi:FAD:protein FMN transferase